MKKSIQPTWHHDAVVTCTCGESFTTGATIKALEVDICSKCHPFFTGEIKFVDRQGRVDKFLQKQKKAQALKDTKSGKNTKSAKPSNQSAPKTYQQILRQQQTAIKQSAKKQTSDDTTADDAVKAA